jgi:hypothetical protein
LFLWSLLLNRMDMATLFWRNGKDHIGGHNLMIRLLCSKQYSVQRLVIKCN